MVLSPKGTLEPLQLQILDAFRGVGGAYLTCGAALGHFYLGHRRTLDLDMFTDNLELLDTLADKLASWCIDQGLQLSQNRSFRTYRRYVVVGEADQAIVDLVHDPVPQTIAIERKPLYEGLRIDSIEDIAANKLSALLGRCETKDLVDVFFLAKAGREPLGHLQAARQRDGGLDPATLAYVVHQMPIEISELLLVKKLAKEELEIFRNRLVEQLETMAFPD
ncbi:MAG: nucleotidyl transferase AbiEii/AbiGii toxin family protein [Proteobacteria bacterium]|nr:nucleotidyl transferase AbiEii/AbiGii toxin family protein [Pseudomonadota bacterium]